MKKIISWVLATLLIFAMPVSAIAETTESTESTDTTASVIWDGTVADMMSVGEGTEDDPFIISTPQELAFLAYGVNEYGYETEGYYFELGADIYLNDTSVENWQESANVWTPIGTMNVQGDTTLAFRGNFDGKGHKIVGLYTTELSYAGLFDCTDGAIVKNIVLEDAYVSGNFAGGIAAWHNSGIISNCTVYGEIISTNCAGGIVGANLSNIEGCTNYAAVESERLAGGIAGGIDMHQSLATVKQCINYGAVSSYIAGGIMAAVSNYNDSLITECLNAGSLSGVVVGGIVGSTLLYDNSTNVVTVSDCANNGDMDVLMDGIGAGIVGKYQDGVIVKNCWNSGKAALAENAAFAGVAAKELTSTVAASDTTTDTTTDTTPVPTFESCYYLDTTAESGSLGFDVEPEGIYAVSAEAAAEQATFEGFDFTTVWGIADGEPVLRFAHEHTFDRYLTDKTYHYHACECGVTEEGEKHTLGEWEIIFDATCEDEGMTGRKCSICNTYIETEVIDAYGCLRGDVNNDGVIDADDYILLKRIYFGTAKMENLDLPQTAVYRCDVNIDSLVNADDYICLKRAYFGAYTIG